MVKPKPNAALKMAIFASGQEQREVARKANVSPQKLSHVIRGRRFFDDDEMNRVADVLGKSVRELFVETAVA